MPQPVTDLDVVFGVRAMELLPEWSDIPEDFRSWGGRGDARPWVQFQSDWFFKGLPKGTRFIAVDGIDAQEAVRHLRAIQGSWEPKHEHKAAGVAYLASLWFTEVPGAPA